jgi:hypothetical protein
MKGSLKNPFGFIEEIERRAIADFPVVLEEEREKHDGKRFYFLPNSLFIINFKTLYHEKIYS